MHVGQALNIEVVADIGRDLDIPSNDTSPHLSLGGTGTGQTLGGGWPT